MRARSPRSRRSTCGRHLLALATLLLVSCAHAAPRDPHLEATSAPDASSDPLAHAIKVVTFNVHHSSGPSIARVLATDPALANADLIVLEEVRAAGGCSDACFAADVLGLHEAYAPRFVVKAGTEGVAILSRAPIESARAIELVHFQLVWNGEPNVALVVTTRIGNQPLTVYAIHLTNRLSVRQRRRQMVPLLEDARRRATPVIIAGDVNTTPLTWIDHVIPLPLATQASHLEKLVRSYGFATPVSASGSTYRWLPIKLDAIYTRGMTTKYFGTARAGDISDHFALWAVMIIR
ncbi:MAG: metal-dependent hydrolase [Myxococcales bacterium]|nr:metal-dependent hydrolase [Myxococcales bacterium]